MTTLQNKIDFALVINVKNANPNGDPLNGNRPRTTFDGLGEISDVCLKRKIRNQLLYNKESILVQSANNNVDGMPSIKSRAESDNFGLGKDAFDIKKTSEQDLVNKACNKWFDVRAFGQLFAFKVASNSVSVGIRGPVTIQSAFSIDQVTVTSTQITKSVNSEGDGTKKGSDTMGMKHRVDNATYITYGSMNSQLAERTGFSYEDAEKLKNVLLRLFEGDASTARPEGSMSVGKLIWWEHNSKLGQYSSAVVHNSVSINNDGTVDIEQLNDLTPEIINGF